MLNANASPVIPFLTKSHPVVVPSDPLFVPFQTEPVIIGEVSTMRGIHVMKVGITIKVPMDISINAVWIAALSLKNINFVIPAVSRSSGKRVVVL